MTILQHQGLSNLLAEEAYETVCQVMASGKGILVAIDIYFINFWLGLNKWGKKICYDWYH